MRNKIQNNETINELQDEVIEEFSDFDDWMDKYQLLIDLGMSKNHSTLNIKRNKTWLTVAKAVYGYRLTWQTAKWFSRQKAMHW